MSLNIPNSLSLFRIVAAPFLLLAGWLEMPKLDSIAMKRYELK